MPNFSQIIQIGHLTRDPQLSYTPSQTAVCEFGVATNKKINGKDKPCFIECKAFGKTAENIQKFFSKSRAILVSGELEFDQWTSQDGTKRSKHWINVRTFSFVESAEQIGPPRTDVDDNNEVNLDNIPF